MIVRIFDSIPDKLNKSDINNNHDIFLSDNNFNIEQDIRGTNKKFWINNTNKTNGHLFKSSVNKSSNFESNGYCYGEVLYSTLCGYLNVDHTPYLLCEHYKEDGSVELGTLSPNYRKGKYDIEYSGRNLFEKYKNTYEENNFGRSPNIEYNTVYEYIKELQFLYSNRMDFDKFRDFQDYLLKICLIDFLTCQTDRHWGNLGFMINSETGIKGMTVIPVYDNESCFMMNKPLKTLEELAESIKKCKDPYKGITLPLSNGTSRSPRLGLKTSLVDFNENGSLTPKKFEENKLSNTEKLAEELAEEINKNENLKHLWESAKTTNIVKVFEKNTEIPENIRLVASHLWACRVKQLSQALKKVEEKEYE